jgi:CheY-like chemotaxis protein
MAKILVVDDTQGIRNMLQKALVGWGHEVTVLEDGGEAIRFLAATKVDLLITDMYMPEVDGVELIRRLRGSGTVGRIVAMSGGGSVSSETTLALAGALGADEELAKPFSLTSLKEIVDGLIADLASEVSAGES